MTYLDRIITFERWLENNYLPVPSQLMYYKFLSSFNRAGWSEWVSVDNRRVMYVMQQSEEKTMIRTRDKLVNAGLIEYRKGKKGSPNQYRLLSINTGFLTVETPVNMPVKTPVEMTAETPVIYRYKTKTEEPSPDGDDKKTALAAVMTAYMDKISPTPSQSSLDELKGYVENMGSECCLRAIDAALDAKAANWNYIRKVLQNKASQGVRCVADWDRLEAGREKQKAKPRKQNLQPACDQNDPETVRRAREDMERTRRMVERMKQESGE